MLRSLMFMGFWDEWEDRFESNSQTYITPMNEAVVSEANNIPVEENQTETQKAKEVWLHVYRTTKYSLSDVWKTPEETLEDGIGDCEDVDFLMLSILPHKGIDEAFLVIGDLVRSSGRRAAHTWVEVNGTVMDPTGRPEDVRRVSYDERRRFRIVYDGIQTDTEEVEA